jgi:hypothetical protein
MAMRMLVVGVVVMVGTAVLADVQRIAPGSGLQDAIVIDTGTNGICETSAARGDGQAATVGQGARNQNALRCGSNRTVDTTAQGDDVQLVAVGGVCRNANVTIVDTGANGIPETVPVGDDAFAPGIALGVAPANRPCVITGPDGIAQTATRAGDDGQLILLGKAEANTDVVRCGPNLIAETSANNTVPGDDVQRVAPGASCTEGQAVVDSGADGIATTRAQGPDLRIELVRPVRLVVSTRRPSTSKLVKFLVRNVEFGATAPGSRRFRIRAGGGSCPGGTVSQIDADPRTPGLQANAAVALGHSAKASLVVTMGVEDVTTVDKKNPFRCSFGASVVALDADPNVDDAANDDANTTPVILDVLDQSDIASSRRAR